MNNIPIISEEKKMKHETEKDFILLPHEIYADLGIEHNKDLARHVSVLSNVFFCQVLIIISPAIFDKSFQCSVITVDVA